MNISNDEPKISWAKFFRPWPMTVACVLGFLFCAFLFFFNIASYLFAGKIIYDDIMLMVNLIFISHFLAFIGYWLMRRWGLYVYVLGLISILIGAFTFGWHFRIQHYLVAMFIIGIGLFYFKRMK